MPADSSSTPSFVESPTVPSSTLSPDTTSTSSSPANSNLSSSASATLLTFIAIFLALTGFMLISSLVWRHMYYRVLRETSIAAQNAKGKDVPPKMYEVWIRDLESRVCAWNTGQPLWFKTHSDQSTAQQAHPPPPTLNLSCYFRNLAKKALRSRPPEQAQAIDQPQAEMLDGELGVLIAMPFSVLRRYSDSPGDRDIELKRDHDGSGSGLGVYVIGTTSTHFYSEKV